MDEHCKKLAGIFRVALKQLVQKRLEAFYFEANQELNDDFDATSEDGLDAETK